MAECLFFVASPSTDFRIGSVISELGIAEGGLNMLVPQSLSDGGEADAVVDEFGRMSMAQLMQGACDTRHLTVFGPFLLSRLIPQRPTLIIFVSAEEGAMLIALLAQILFEERHQRGIIEQDGALALPFAQHRDVFIVQCEVEILDMN